MEGHITFSKQDIFCNLEGTIPEARSEDTEFHKKALLPHPPLPILEVQIPTPQTQWADDTILVSLECTPNNEALPAEPTTSPAETNADNTLPGSAETSSRGNTMIPLANINTDTPIGQWTNQATSPAEAEGQVVPTTRLVDKLAGPPTPSYQVGEEKECMLTDHFHRKVELGGHPNYPQRHCDCLSCESGFWKLPHGSCPLGTP